MALVGSWNEELHYCSFGLALLKGNNRSSMDQYLLGSVDPYHLARVIHHNNTFHKGNTGNQMGDICDIVNAKNHSLSDEEFKLYKQELMLNVKNNFVEIKDKVEAAEAQLKIHVTNIRQNPCYAAQICNYVPPTIINKMQLTYHQDHYLEEYLNFNNLILSPYDSSKGELPVFTVACASVDQQNEKNDVMITEVVPPPPKRTEPTMAPASKKRRRENDGR